MKNVLRRNASGQPTQWEEDGCIVTRSHARSGPGCHNACGIITYVKDGKVVKVEGDPDNPFNRGRLCPRCLAVTDVVYSEQRLLHPMRRAFEDRGKDAWEQISWDEAIDEISARFSSIIEEHGPETIVYMQGTGRDINAYITTLCQGLGSPNWGCALNGHSCYIPRINGMMALAGTSFYADCAQMLEQRYDDPRYTPPACMLIWANNPIYSSADGFFGHWVVDLMKMGKTKFVVIDPRLTWLAAQADLWLQIRPGTDGALALGMLNVIINEDLYDHDFVDKWTYGFAELAERVQEYPTDKVAQITWIDEEKIVQAARMYATAKPAAIQWGLKIDQAIGGVEAAMAIAALFTITGNVDIPGGNIAGPNMFAEPVPWESMIGVLDNLPDDVKGRTIGLEEYPLFHEAFALCAPDVAEQAMLTDKPYKIQGGWWQTTNPIACMGGNVHQWEKAIGNIPFNVFVDLFMTPSIMAFADIVLPACTFLERNGSSGIAQYYVGGAAINKAIEPLGESLPDAEICLRVGKSINPENFPWKSWDDWNSSSIRNMSWEELSAAPFVYSQWEYKKYEKGLLRPDGKPGFMTATGRIELWSTRFNRFGYDPLTHYVEPEETPVAAPELAEEYPLILTTGARNICFFHSEHRQIPRLRRVHPDPLVEMHPDTAAAAGLSEGEWCIVENKRGSVKMRVHISEGISPRVVSADHGWWFPEADPEELYRTFDSNINVLTPGNCGETGFGSDYACNLCRVRKVEEGE